MTRKIIWSLIIALGFGFLFLAFFSDLLRNRPFYLGWTQLGMLVIGFILVATGLVIRSGRHLMWFNKKYFPIIGFFFLVFLSSAIIAYVKVDAFNSWRYTSDLFSFNTVIHENARGNWGLEFTYGNAFGDHAYFFLILLTPFKFFLNSKTIYALLLSGPIAYATSSIVFFYAVKHLTSLKRTLLLSITLLLGFGITYSGLFENRYGMHPDTYSGYLAVSMVALLLWRENLRAHNQNSTFQTIGVLIFLTLFLIQKEEMALLAIIFFAIVWIFKRTPFHRNLLIISLLYFGFALILMRWSRTPFNRTNNSIIDSLVQTIQENGFRFLYIDSNGDLNLQLIYWIVIVVSSIIFLIALRVSGKYHPYTISLFITGIIKMLFSLSVEDFDLTTWHNFPGIIMLTGALLVQITITETQPKLTLRFIVLLVVLSTAFYMAFDIPYVSKQLTINANRKLLVNQLKSELVELKELVDPLRVVALPKYSEQPWVNFRYSLYPRGVYWSPVGLADYILFPYNEARSFTVDYTTAPPPSYFDEIFRTKNYILFRRSTTTEEEEANREYFNRFGIE